MTPIPRYCWLLFDADGTLFDYDRAEASALAATFGQFDLPLAPGTAHAYRAINHQCWQALERGEITPAALRTRRFELLFDAAGLRTDVECFSTAYLENLAESAELLNGAAELLAALRGRFRFAIITNGLRAVQRGRLARSAIRADIAALIISEEVGSAKPAPGIFDAAFAAMGSPAKAEVLMIGDSLTSDMRGACDYGIDACWYNPDHLPRPAGLPITYEISRLDELVGLLGMDTTQDLNTIFETLKGLLSAYAPPCVPKMDDDRHYDLWSVKDLLIEGRKRKEVYFAGLILQKGYVGFYYMPVYAEAELKAVFAPELLKLLKGKSCFHIRKLTPELLAQIEAALKTGYEAYQLRGWV